LTRIFDRFAAGASRFAGRPWAFLLACALVLIWLVTGPFFGWSDTWQLVINTGTTIITFLMCFLIQSAQVRDAAAVSVRLDELIRVSAEARNELIGVEEKTADEIVKLREVKP
jgi:low affinity Fe/Cu permease